MSKKAAESSGSVDGLERAHGNNNWWPGAVLGGLVFIALLPTLPALLSRLLSYGIDVPLPVLAALGVVAGRNFTFLADNAFWRPDRSE